MTSHGSPSAYINGLILSGGKSSRMGHDKSLIAYHGQPQREYLTALLKKFCKGVFLSCKPSADIPETLHPLYDQFDLESPLNGILSAFRHDPTVAWLTVPVDMPMVSDTVLQYLIAHRDPHKVATCFYDSEGKNPEPLLTLWEPAAALPLQKFYTCGNTSPRKFLLENMINILVPPAPEISQNINTPEELARFLSGNHPS